MKALVKAKKEQGIWLLDVEKPSIGPNDVLVKIVKTAICGTDIHIYNWDEWSQATVPVPMVTGHEFFGIIEEIGSQVPGFRVGDRVTGEGHITCGHCRNCRAGKRHLCRNTLGIGVNRQGCFAEYLSIPMCNVFPVPDSVTDEMAAIFDPFGNATHSTLAFNMIGEDILITGAGPIGCMSAAIAKHVGARHVVVTEINPYRIKMAEQMGATIVFDPTKKKIADVMSDLGMKEGFDVGLEMSGHFQALRDMISMTNHGGKLALLGIPGKDVSVDWGEIILKGLTIKGIYGREIFESWYKMCALLESGLDLSPMITHTFAVDDYEEAFQVMRSGESGKVILDWV
jgi:threonine 3-dehydrogenase